MISADNRRVTIIDIIKPWVAVLHVGILLKRIGGELRRLKTIYYVQKIQVKIHQLAKVIAGAL